MAKARRFQTVRHAVARLSDFLNSPPDPPDNLIQFAQAAPVSAPAPAREEIKRRPDTRQYGASGTPNISGFIQDMQEYLPELRGRAALGIYEKMRRSDADCAAIAAACKLPIRAAEYTIAPGAKEGDTDFALAKQIAEDVREQLFGGLESTDANGVTTSQRFESVIENALLCLDYGCAASEDLWVIDGDKIRLRKIAPRLPLTFYQFPCEPDGETLQALVQWGYRGSHWVTAAVPASKISMFSYRMEGANFYGRSMFREAYQHWYIKNALYRIDSIACERNGMGIPFLEMAPTPTEEDRLTGENWLQNLATNESAGLMAPQGTKLSLVGVTGQEHKILPSIQHHSEMISKSALAMFMSLGSTQSGSRALGNVMVDFFQLSIESTARFICDTISETTIRRYVDYNYARKDGERLPYPRLSVPNIAVINPLDIMAAMKDVADSKIDFLQPTDETEDWLRGKIGMPLRNGKPSRTRFAPVVQRIQEEDTGTPEQIEEGKGKPAPVVAPAPALKPAKAKPAVGKKLHDIDDDLDDGPYWLAIARRLPGIAVLRESAKPTRELLPHEKKHDFAGHAARQDSTQTAIRRILGGVSPALNREAARRAAQYPPDQLGALSLPADRFLTARIEKAVDIAHKYGYDQVYAERYRATKRPKTEKPQRVTLSNVPSAHQDTPNLIAKTAIADLHNAVVARAKSAQIDVYKTGLRDGDLEDEMVNMLDEMSIGFLDRIALEAARSGVAGGRFAALQELQGEISSYAWSAAMDQNTCQPCQELDGTEWSSIDDIDTSPGDTCDGADACRCQIMPIFSDEGTIELE